MQFAGFAILVVANCYLGGEKSARNVILRNATVVGCVGKEQMKTLFDTRPKMHFARVDNSPRLQRVLGVLKDSKAHTTLDLIQEANVCAVNSIICELRMNGHDITCKRKGDVWKYQLVYRN